MGQIIKSDYDRLISKVYDWFKKNTHNLGEEYYDYKEVNNPFSYLKIIDLTAKHSGHGLRVILYIMDSPVADTKFKVGIDDLKLISIPPTLNKNLTHQKCFIQIDSKEEVIKDYLFTYQADLNLWILAS